MMQAAGSIRKVNKRTIEVPFHGDLEFYGGKREEPMRQYVARFTNGRVEWIRGGIDAPRYIAEA